ncbi:hypothetical protein NZD89_16310 [Alicyclobacillus fastidiosus]|uniref:Uncharacterized protein n=1 Tax=Alicyclobacillus fastidiosus TaxID=392011 RepID=A0ABY6ZCP3_9BACL|nr:hypothetical protein [Alicyclobacillus fastidiosus]WAH39959.1 hypothetical protein NZD89_16310 [Alicyclobacillus fastidiosus]
MSMMASNWLKSEENAESVGERCTWRLASNAAAHRKSAIARERTVHGWNCHLYRFRTITMNTTTTATNKVHNPAIDASLRKPFTHHSKSLYMTTRRDSIGSPNYLQIAFNLVDYNANRRSRLRAHFTRDVVEMKPL